MKVVIQRVQSAQVSVDRKVVGQINSGLLLLVGIEDADEEDDISWLSKKILNTSILPNDKKNKLLQFQSLHLFLT